ncbi:uncharacterized protein LOC129909448 [Episyrphus balteatus]|uniref:uncharacterized protein LOC129909448 n=1 Tax=Episyrphus balteatus TaxID=286459 RepID=UPI0024865C34|nr:uncharacterized protein LOC129909448 [Episyrphus balteatus]
MLCFKCLFDFETLAGLVTHFRLIHGLNSTDIYSCIYDNCNQLFSNLSAFKKHTKTIHLKIKNPVKLPTLNSINHSHYVLETVEGNSEPIIAPSTSSVQSHISFSPIIPEYSSLKKSISSCCEEFSLNLHTNNNFTRKDVIQIQEGITKITLNIINSIKTKIMNYIPDKEMDDLIEFFDFCGEPFSDMKSEYKLFQRILDSNKFAKPQMFTINNEVSEIILQGKPTLDASNVQGCIMPIEFQFRKFFELPGVLNQTLNNLNLLLAESDITHLVNSSCFKNTAVIYAGKTIIPFFLYLDDFEINNPLGSHATVDSICGVYYSFPTLPQHLLSNLKYIFVAAYFKTKEKKYTAMIHFFGL